MQLEAEQVAGTLAAAAAVIAWPLAESHGAAADEVAVALVGRLDALALEPTCAGLPAALRRAELQALQVVLAVHGAGLSADAAAGGSAAAFQAAAVAWSANMLAQLEQHAAAPGLRRVKRPVAAGEGPWPTLAQRRVAAEAALLGELDVVLGPWPLPQRFLDLFLDSARSGAGWFDAFGLYVAAHLRADVGLQSALAAVPIPGLARIGLSGPHLLETLFEQARRQAHRLEAHLQSSQGQAAAADAAANTEIESYLERVPRELAAQHGVPPAALLAAAAALRAGGFVWTRYEELLDEQARCLAALIRDLAALARGQAGPAGSVAAAARALALLRDGQIEAAREALARSPVNAFVSLASARLAALAADWDGAKTALNRAVADPSARPRERPLDVPRELSRVLAESQGAEAHKAAVEVCTTLLGPHAAGLEEPSHAEVLIRLAGVATRMSKGPAQLQALATAAQALDGRPAAASKLPLALQVRLARAAGDVALALSAHGADRIGDAVRAYVEGIRLAAELRDARLASELHVGLADALLARARTAGKAEGQRLHAEALAALRTARTPRLRARDPIWWSYVERRLAETALSAATADPASAAALLRGGIVAAKAATRLLPAGLMAEPLARGQALIGDLYAALAKGEADARWRAHALAAYGQALISISAQARPALWCTVMEAKATLTSTDAATADELQATVTELRAAARTAEALAPVQQARIERLLGDALAASGRRRLDLAHLVEAASTYAAALGRIEPKAAPVLWCQCWVGLAGVVRERARLAPRPGELGAFIGDLEAAVVIARGGLSPGWIAAALTRELNACRASLSRISGGRASQRPRSA